MSFNFSVCWSSCEQQDKMTLRKRSKSFQPSCLSFLYHLLDSYMWSDDVPFPPPARSHNPFYFYVWWTVTVSVFQSFSLRPLQVVLPSREDQDSPIIDINLHLPLLCFTPTTLLQVTRVKENGCDRRDEVKSLNGTFTSGALLPPPRTENCLFLV